MNESLNCGSRQCLEKVVACASAKFDESVDVVVSLGIDSRKSDEQVRGVVVLPKGIGKSIKVAVFARGEHVLGAERVGADIVGGEDLVEEVKRGRKLDVDWCVTTPDFMPMVAPIAKVLGSKGLMPNPKFGTVTFDIGETVKIIKSGQIKFRADKGGIVHGKIGNIKFSIDDLLENLKVFIRVIKENKPASVKGVYFKGVFLNSTMGKAYKVGKIEEII